jgi:hypothetical protein
MKHLSIAKRQSASSIDKAGATWQRNVERQQRIIAEAQARLVQPWCVGQYETVARNEIAAAERKLAKLMAE